MEGSTINKPTSESSQIGDKEWLDLSWKYFQQHSQQRISHFNFFVIFSTILTSGFVTTFQKDYVNPFLSIGLSIIQLFVAFIFFKIDARNSFLVKHAEDILKGIEERYASVTDNLLFRLEESKTGETILNKSGQFSVFKLFTHGKSYRWFYRFFFSVGIVELFIAIVMVSNPSRRTNNEKNVYYITKTRSYIDTNNAIRLDTPIKK